jgi:uncharacterized hydantoinase/oxoprolinase family protein
MAVYEDYSPMHKRASEIVEQLYEEQYSWDDMAVISYFISIELAAQFKTAEGCIRAYDAIVDTAIDNRLAAVQLFKTTMP